MDADADAVLARAVAAGDMSALAGIYDRYADRLHDYCWSVLRDRDEAADAVQEVFITAARRLGQLREPEKLRAWLYAVARHEALRRIGLRRRETITEEVPELPTIDPSLDAAAQRSELATLVWDAAAGLPDRDRAVLDLHVRQGLDGQELADALGVTASHAYVLTSRLRDSVGRSLGALLVARLGSEDCAELSRILERWDGKFTPLIRKRVARHVDSCDLCDERRRTVASPMALLSAVPMLPAPVLLRSRVLGHIQRVADEQSTSAAAPPDNPGWLDSGFPPGIGGQRWRPASRLPYVAAAVVIVLLAVAAAVGVASSSPGGVSPAAVSASRSPSADVSGATGGPTPTTAPPSGAGAVAGTGGVPGAAGPPPPAPPAPTTARLTLGSHALDFGTSGQERTVELTSTGVVAYHVTSHQAWLNVRPRAGTVSPSGPVQLTVSIDRSAAPAGAATGEFDVLPVNGTGGGAVSVEAGAPAVRRVAAPTLSVSAAPIKIGIAQCKQSTATVTATVSSPGSIRSVTVQATVPGSGEMREPMTGSGSTYTATVGNAPKPGQLTYQVTATDATGQSSSSAPGSITVTTC
jgi:RNA polymerase sigma factor (sigma-70 family)